MKKSSTFVAKLTIIVDPVFISIQKNNLISKNSFIIYKTNMKRLFQLTLMAALCLSTGVKAQVSNSKWQSQPIVIDGDGSDWGTNPRFFNAESNVKYEFRNDAQNLYLIIKSADRTVQLQMLKAGFNVKLKVKTSPPLRTTITFPTLKDVETAPVAVNTEDKLIDKSVSHDEFSRDTAILDGFQYSKGKISSEKRDEKTVCFSRSKSPRELTFYEIRVPLRELFGDNFSLETISSIPIQLQVNINDLSQSTMRKMKGKGGMGRSGGMGRGMGGGGRGGMGGGRNEGMGGDLQSQQEADLPGGNIGEVPGTGELDGGMQGNNMRGGYSMEKKSFSIDFHLSDGK
jgi:hypothetical protein